MTPRTDFAALLRHAADLLELHSAGPCTHYGMVAAALHDAANNLELLFCSPKLLEDFARRYALKEHHLEQLINMVPPRHGPRP